MPRNVLYKDHTVQIGDCYLIIYKYYFPLATSKTIMFSEIQRVSLEDGIGAGQNWGLCTRYMNNWFPLDRSRKNKLKFISVQMKGKKILPSFTPEDPEKVLQIIYENFTEEGRKVAEYRLSHCGKETEIAQQQLIERLKEEEDEKVVQTDQKVVQKNQNPPLKENSIKVQNIQSIQLF